MTEDSSGGPAHDLGTANTELPPPPGVPADLSDGIADTIIPPPPGAPSDDPGLSIDPAVIAAGVAAGVAAVAAAPVVAAAAAGVAAGAAAAAAAAFVLQTMSPPAQMLAETNENPDAPPTDTDGDGIEG